MSALAPKPTAGEIDAEVARRLAGEPLHRGHTGRKQIMPEGLGWLKSVLDETRPEKHPNLAALSRFQRLLVENGSAHRKVPFKALRWQLGDLSQMPPMALVRLTWKPRIPVSVSETMLKIAIAARVEPSVVVSVLLCYGLEHLAAETRAHAVAPPVKLPQRQLPDSLAPQARPFIGA